MKKISILVASILVFGSFSTRAFAADANTQISQTTEAAVSFKDEAGITPDSLLYTIDQAVDKLRVLLASSDEKKAEVIADIAEERLGESEVMAEKGETALAEKALEDYNNKITEAAEKLQTVVNNTEAASEENTNEKLEQSIIDLEKSIQDVQEKSLAVLENLKDVIAKEGTEAVEKVIEEQTAHKEAVANFVKERHEFNAVKKDLNMAKVALKKIEKGGDEEAIKKAQEELTLKQQAYMEAKAELHTAFQAKKATEGAKIKEEDKPTSTDTTATVEENNKAIDAAKPTEYIKTNNGNGNGNKDKSNKIEKDDDEDEDDKDHKEDKKDKEKTAPGKSGEEHGKSDKSNGNKR